MPADQAISPNSSTPQLGSPTLPGQPSSVGSSKHKSTTCAIVCYMSCNHRVVRCSAYAAPHRAKASDNNCSRPLFTEHVQPQQAEMPDHSFAARSSWPHPFDHLEEANPARDQTATEPAAVGTNQDGFSLGDVRDWQPPARELGRFIPPGMDEASYVAGERAALLRAFRETLPSQQALGSLFHAVQQLTRRVDQEGSDVHQIQMALAGMSVAVQAYQARLDALEQMRIPALEERVQEISRNSAEDFHTALNAFGDTMAASLAHHSQPQSSYFAVGARQAQWLLATFGGYATKALSKADVAVMFLSRKILVDQIGLAAITPSLPAYSQQHGSPGSMQHWPVAYANGHLGAGHEPRSVRAVLGAVLFLAAVESGWQMHHRTVRLLPKNLQAAVSPLQLGLRILRGAVWTAALTVTAVQTRHACYSTADAFISAVTQLKLRYRPPKRRPALQGSQAVLLADQHEGSKEPVEVASCSVDVAAGGAGLLESAPAGLS